MDLIKLQNTINLTWRNIMKLKFLLVILLIFFNLQFAQESEVQQDSQAEKKMVVILMNDGSEIIGQIESETEDAYSIKTPAGLKMQIPMNIIVQIKDFKGKVEDGKLMMADPNRSMYLFSPSAFPVGDKNKYCRDFCLFFPSMNYGFGNNLSFQAGVFWIPGMSFKDVPIIGSGKYTFYNDNHWLASAGMMYIRMPGDLVDNGGVGVTFITGTRGDSFNHFSISTGFGFAQYEGEWEFMSRPIIVFAGNKRISNSLSLVTENWLFPEAGLENLLFSLSTRYFGKKIAVDIGAMFTFELLGEGLPFPIINFTYHFE